jgi:hypothetical protein
VLAAGEISFGRQGQDWVVSEVSNLSTGYCPEPGSWPAVASALDRIGLAHPGDYTSKIVFRRCPACHERNIVRDESFVCAVCGAALPAAWNFTGAPGRRPSGTGAGATPGAGRRRR